VAVCTVCGAENREGARFCDSCAAPLAAALPGREVRKTVTVLFCDVSGSTALGERIDPESLRRVMARYFGAAKAVVERHEGTVEKFIGDAVMAVFGVPVAHEDDALRAVRTAEGLREALAILNEELARDYGTRLELRTGVNTGEVVTGTAERLATGDAVNVAARLEQAAQPGEVLLGEATLALVRDAVEVEPVAPLELKGKAAPVQAFRLLAIRSGSLLISRRQEVPMVGRERQRKMLEDGYANVAGERACQLFTVLGTAGVGKSRLVAEFLGTLEGASLARGRCLSYGEGISYWPVTEAVKQLLGDAPEARLDELGLDEASAAALSPILGEQAVASSPDAIAWAVRKLFEASAAERPLVVVFEDIHWGEPTFLDLVEHVADFSRDAPILLLCMARPELLDRRPAWGGGKLNATTLLLEPLGPGETDELIERLLPHALIDATLRRRILEAAGGNPLFVEEMLAMLAEVGAGDGNGAVAVAVPPTIQALLASRLDQLDAADRRVLERGSVEGQVFHRSAVVALAPEEPQVEGRLMTLVRKDLVRPERSTLAGDEAFRFRHLLIRDAAYEALPKASRAELHERFAAWLGEHAADLVELDEIVGYHLEQAYRYRAELGPLDGAARALAPRAADRLLTAARRAHERGDLPAAQSLFTRAGELFPAESESRRAARLGVATTLHWSGQLERADQAFEELIAEAKLAGDERVEARAALDRIELRVQRDSQATMADALREAEEVAGTLELLGDDEALGWAWKLVGQIHGWQGRSAEGERLLERARVPAKQAGRSLLATQIHVWLNWAAWYGPTPTDEGLRRCDELIAAVTGSSGAKGETLVLRGAIAAMRGRFDEGRADAAAGRAMLHELGQVLHWAGTSMVAADVEFLAGDPRAAAALLQAGYDTLKQSAETGYIATVMGMRAQAALAQGRFEQALRLADETEAIAAPDDFEPHVRLRCVRALALASSNDVAGAQLAIRDALAIAEPTDYLPVRAFAALSLADVERRAGRAEAEASALEEALRLSELKGDLVTAARTQTRLAALGREGTAAP